MQYNGVAHSDPGGGAKVSDLVSYLQKPPNVQASTAANHPLHTPMRPFTRASRPISSLGGVTGTAGEKKTDSTTRLLLTSESAAMSHTPTRTNQLPSRWRQGRNGPAGNHSRTSANFSINEHLFADVLHVTC